MRDSAKSYNVFTKRSFPGQGDYLDNFKRAKFDNEPSTSGTFFAGADDTQSTSGSEKVFGVVREQQRGKLADDFDLFLQENADDIAEAETMATQGTRIREVHEIAPNAKPVQPKHDANRKSDDSAFMELALPSNSCAGGRYVTDVERVNVELERSKAENLRLNQRIEQQLGELEILRKKRNLELELLKLQSEGAKKEQEWVVKKQALEQEYERKIMAFKSEKSLAENDKQQLLQRLELEKKRCKEFQQKLAHFDQNFVTSNQTKMQSPHQPSSDKKMFSHGPAFPDRRSFYSQRPAGVNERNGEQKQESHALLETSFSAVQTVSVSPLPKTLNGKNDGFLHGMDEEVQTDRILVPQFQAFSIRNLVKERPPMYISSHTDKTDFLKMLDALQLGDVLNKRMKKAAMLNAKYQCDYNL